MDSENNPFLRTIRLPVVNRDIFVFVVSLHFISLCLPWLSGLSLINKLILTLFPVFGLGFYWRQYYREPSQKQVSQIVLHFDDSWQVRMNSGEACPATLGPAMFLHPLLTIICLEYNGIRRYFIFTPSVTNRDTLRRLRVRLKFRN